MFCPQEDHRQLIGVIVYSVIEYLFGRKARLGTGPGSVIEALLVCGYIGFKRVFTFLRRKKQ